MHVHDDAAAAVEDLREGERLLIDALVGDGAEGHGHLHRRDAGGAERQAERVGVDVLVRHAQQVQVFDRALDADVRHQDLRGGGVVRVDERGAEALRSLVAAAAVVLGPGIAAAAVLPAGDGHRHVVGDGGGRGAQVDGRGVDRQRLDGGADGHLHVAGAVERLARGGLVAPADDRLELARAVVIDARGGLRLLDLGVGAVRVAGLIDLVGRVAQAGIVVPRRQRVLHDGLNLRVDAQVDAVSAGAQLVLHRIAVGGGVLEAVQVEERVHHVGDGVLDVVRVGVDVAGGRGGFQHGCRRGIERGLVFLRGDHAVFQHLAQDVVGAVVGDVRGVAALGVAGVEVAAGVVVVRAAGHAGEHRAFAQGQLAQLLAEVAVGCDLDAVVVAAQEDRVEIALQNLVLGVARFQLHGQIGLLQLALVGVFVGEHGVLDELLGDRGAALRGAGDDVGDERADDALDVHAVVLVKARILHGDKGVLQRPGDLLDGDHDAVLGALVVGDEVALAVVDERGLVLRIQRGEVERGRGIHIRLGDADERAQTGQPRADQHDGQQAQGRDGDAQHEIGRLGARLEDGARARMRLARGRGRLRRGGGQLGGPIERLLLGGGERCVLLA